MAEMSDRLAWLCRQLRLSVFLAGVVADSESASWWQHVRGADPETEVNQRPMKLLRQEGEFETGRLFMLSLADRVDWIWQATDKPEPTQDLATLGPFDETVEKFQSLMDNWLTICPIAVRVALGAEVVAPVDSVDEGYERLQRYLPSLKLAPGKSSDLMYRINRPRDSKNNPELKINRLSTWSLLQGAVLSFRLTAPGGPGSSVTVSPSTRPACRLEVDISTAPAPQIELKQSELQALLREFAELATQAAQQGDVE